MKCALELWRVGNIFVCRKHTFHRRRLSECAHTGKPHTDPPIFIIITVSELKQNFLKCRNIFEALVSIKTLRLFCFLGCRYFRFISKQDDEVLKKKIKRIKKSVENHSIVNPGLWYWILVISDEELQNSSSVGNCWMYYLSGVSRRRVYMAAKKLFLYFSVFFYYNYM